jgi:zinc and cadmium transporter
MEKKRFGAEKMLILWITFFSLLGSVGAIITAAAFLLFREKIQRVLIPCLISYATGTLLAAALLGLLSHALKITSPLPILSTVLMGIIVFFFLRKWWFGVTVMILSVTCMKLQDL